MSTLCEIKLWGTTIGAARTMDYGVTEFTYHPDFLQSGIELSPLHMPLKAGAYRFPALSAETFKGLPGMLSDSLPDKFGNAIIDAWLTRQGRARESMSAVERLCYIGTRGMGALEFHPAVNKDRYHYPDLLNVRDLVMLASEILRDRAGLETQFSGDEAVKKKAFADILHVGTSAGGARAKALIAWNQESGEVRSGQLDGDPSFSQWLIKFDGVDHNSDKEDPDPQGYGLIEYAYAQMARAAGLQMNDCELFKENGRSHFMTRRFDRTAEGGKLHMQSLAALEHLDFNLAGAHSYEQAIQVMRSLDLTKPEMEEQMRRMIFNIVARNQDDHVKNISYLMDRSGRWSLSPAYDVTYSYNPAGQWTSQHQMSLQGKRKDFQLADFIAFQKFIGLPNGRAKRVLHEVLDAVRDWKKIAEDAGVSAPHAEKVQENLLLDWK